MEQNSGTIIVGEDEKHVEPHPRVMEIESFWVTSNVDEVTIGDR